MLRRKKDEAKKEQPAPQQTPSITPVKASVKNMGNGELAFANNVLSFSLKKGKQKDTAIKIPLDSIESMRQDGNQFIVVWNGITDRFTMKNSDLPKTMLEKVAAAQAELKNQPEPEAPQNLLNEEQEEEQSTPTPATENVPEQTPPAPPLPEAPTEAPKEEEAPTMAEPEEVTQPEPSPPPVTEATVEPQKEEPKEEAAPIQEPEETKQAEPETPPSPLPQEQPQEPAAQPLPASEEPAEPVAKPEPPQEAPPPQVEVPIIEPQQPQAAAELEPVPQKEPEPPALQPEQPTLTPESQVAPQAPPQESTPEEQVPAEPIPEKPALEDQSAPTLPAPQASVFKASVKNMGKGDLELTGNVLTFSLKKGLFGGKKTVAMKIPLESIEDKRQEENQLVIVWNGITDRFTLKDSNAPKTMLELLSSAQTVAQDNSVQLQQEPEQVPQAAATEPANVPLIQLPKVPEYGFPEIPATPTPEAIPTDVPAVFNMVADVVDPLFDLIRGLHGKVNWKRVEENLKAAKDKAATLSDQTLGKADLSFTKLSEAVKAHVPIEAGAEAFALLKTLREQVDSLAPKPEEAAQGYPKYKSLQTALHAYYTLNDIAFGAELGDEAAVKESVEFANLLDQLSKQTHSSSNTQPLKEAVAKLSRGQETENAVAECRALFRLQFEDQSRSLKYYSRLVEAEVSTEA